ncbi:GntR family transcriptional regulator [Rouxiella sp. Mn2063]|uniref:GntR family transcriptional regulator n=1 Tax=Rouxiella sp. Mn2063 TaxID=3395262 RepID=UPI003BBBA7AF
MTQKPFTQPLSAQPLNLQQQIAGEFRIDPLTSEQSADLPAFERVALLLRENIISGNLYAGQPLLENELSERCGASRNTLREALRYLHGEGLVNYHQNRGVFVRQLDKRDVRDIFKVRRHLEILAVETNPQVSPFHLNRMLALIEQAEQEAENAAWRNVGTLSLRFHQSIVHMLGCQRFNDFFSVILAQLRLLFASGPAERDFQYPWIARDREIYQLLHEGRTSEASQALQVYLELSEKKLMQAFSLSTC